MIRMLLRSPPLRDAYRPQKRNRRECHFGMTKAAFMRLLTYCWLVLRTAFTRALSLAQDIIFAAVILVGFVVWFVPSLNARLSSFATALNGWAFAAIVFGVIMLIRLLLAPFWIWCDQQNQIK